MIKMLYVRIKSHILNYQCTEPLVISNLSFDLWTLDKMHAKISLQKSLVKKSLPGPKSPIPFAVWRSSQPPPPPFLMDFSQSLTEFARKRRARGHQFAPAK